MGLAISVGITGDYSGVDEEAVEYYQARLGELSSALADSGITWREPAGSPEVRMRSHVGGFPYSCLGYLRRVYALVDGREPVTLARGEDDLARDQHIIEARTEMLWSHLLCHSDSAGYYVPVDFPNPLFLPASAGVAGGGMVGSSQGLMRELCRCAPALGIRLDPVESGTDAAGALSDTEAARLFAVPQDADFATESMVWLTLYEASRVSIATGHAIVFA